MEDTESGGQQRQGKKGRSEEKRVFWVFLGNHPSVGRNFPGLGKAVLAEPLGLRPTCTPLPEVGAPGTGRRVHQTLSYLVQRSVCLSWGSLLLYILLLPTPA